MAATITPIENDSEVNCLLNKVFTSPLRSGYVEVGPDKVCLPVYYKNYEERLRKFQVYDDDVFLTGFPKSGTTWCQEMIWLLMHDVDFEGAKSFCWERYRMLERGVLDDSKQLFGVDLLDAVLKMDRPRCIKSHLPWSLLPEEIKNGTKQPKIINIRRNPKDCCVSHYHEAKSGAGFSGTFEQFSELYLAGKVPYGPYWKHVFSYWNERHRPNILLITYEEMRADLPSVIKKTAHFLNKNISNNDVEMMVKHLSFDTMKKNASIYRITVPESVRKQYNYLDATPEGFFRSGEVGNFKTVMSPEIKAKFSAWIDENISGTDFIL